MSYPFCSLYWIIHYINCDMLSKSQNGIWVLFTISRNSLYRGSLYWGLSVFCSENILHELKWTFLNMYLFWRILIGWQSLSQNHPMNGTYFQIRILVQHIFRWRHAICKILQRKSIVYKLYKKQRWAINRKIVQFHYTYIPIAI